MYIDAQTIIKAGSLLAALTAFVTLTWKLFKWIDHQKEQDVEIANLKAQHVKDIADLKIQHTRDIAEVKSMHHKDTEGIQEEQTLVVYGLLACLKGLAELGCDGPVSEASSKIEKYINKKAHGSGKEET